MLDWIAHRPDHARGARSILRAVPADGAQGMVIKVYEKPGAARLRHGHLQWLSAQTPKVVRPLFLAEDDNLFAMPDLGPLTLKQALRPGTEAKFTRQAMHWLQAFCEDTPSQIVRFDPAPLVSDAADALQASALFETAEGQRALAMIEEAFSRFEGRPMRHCTSFGDVKPENLCITGKDRLIAIDYVQGRPQPIARDAAFFLHWMRMHSWRRSLRHTGWPDPDAEAQVRSAIVQSLGATLDPALLDTYTRAFLLPTWATLRRKAREPRLLEAVETALFVGN
ncbi:hypothetical protein [Pacificoceanicola onchidii]|uniref:hypothetical protein n=1 Tax=Pacificoceanicola onchidii TaxID=2562685 RepID=UPI0010A64A0D|nr:hypothetical protein [Pacificoceanicola onchidii]